MNDDIFHDVVCKKIANMQSFNTSQTFKKLRLDEPYIKSDRDSFYSSKQY